MEHSNTSVQQLEAVLSNPAEAYSFVTKHGKKSELIDPLIQILVGEEYELKGSLRTQSIIMIRNGLEGWYSRHSQNRIDDQLKIQLGQILVQKVLAKGESDLAVRKLVATCVGKIGKSNLIGGLDNLFISLTDQISRVLVIEAWDNDPKNYQILNGCLAGLYQIVQNMIRNRTASGQLMLGQIATSHFSNLYQVYSSTFTRWNSVLGQQTVLNLSNLFHSQSLIELSRICLKILGKLCVYGWSRPSMEELPTTFIKQSVYHWLQMIETRQRLISLISLHQQILKNASTSKSIDSFFNLINKHLFRFGKIVIETIEHDWDYLFHLDFSEDLKRVAWQIITLGASNLESDQEYPLISLVLYPERLMIQSLRIMSIGIKNHPQKKVKFLDLNQSIELVRLILTKLLILKAHSIQFWANDPESYENEDVNLMESVNFDVRSCAVEVLKSVLEIYPDEVLGIIFDLHSTVHSQGLNNIPNLLQYESIILSIGISSKELLKDSRSPIFDLRAWIDEKFIPTLLSTDLEGRIVRRRIAWLLGEFSKEDLRPEVYSSFYTAIKCLLENPGNDVATRLTACRAVGESGFWSGADVSNDPINPFVKDFFAHISNLFDEVENLESQKALTVAINRVIEKADVNVKFYASGLVQIMTNLWQQVSESSSKSNSGNHLHNSILVTMASLVKTLGPESQEYHPILAVFIHYSIDPNNPSSIYLKEDGLFMWLDIVEDTGVLSPALESMLPSLSSLIKDSDDNLQNAINIFNGYVLLDWNVTLKTIGREVLKVYEDLIEVEHLPTEVLDAVLGSISLVVWSVGSPTFLRELFDSSNLFFRLIQQSINVQVHVYKRLQFILTVCKIISKDSKSFFKLLKAQINERGFLIGEIGLSFEDYLILFFKECLDKMDNIGKAVSRKLIASSTVIILTSFEELIELKNKDLIEGIIDLWSSVLSQGDEYLDEETGVYCYNEFELLLSANSLGQERYREQIFLKDPIKRQTLGQIISDRLNSGGESLIRKFSESIDGVIIDELRRRLDGTLKG
ncbi:armadillo-type protein [Phakopsora pachyrhizi]|uniref:Armadillo-type protein n=1 Tax=Phakopsora pachyrhizi TaxID=170000 RepID=A0AAV0AKM7_PHAPC|nr:armadillo-type protein [Phakopsora pachyrhizi]